jgi:hypothetical protein
LIENEETKAEIKAAIQKEVETNLITMNSLFADDFVESSSKGLIYIRTSYSALDCFLTSGLFPQKPDHPWWGCISPTRIGLEVFNAALTNLEMRQTLEVVPTNKTKMHFDFIKSPLVDSVRLSLFVLKEQLAKDPSPWLPSKISCHSNDF